MDNQPMALVHDDTWSLWPLWYLKLDTLRFGALNVLYTYSRYSVYCCIWWMRIKRSWSFFAFWIFETSCCCCTSSAKDLCVIGQEDLLDPCGSLSFHPFTWSLRIIICSCFLSMWCSLISSSRQCIKQTGRPLQYFAHSENTSIKTLWTLRPSKKLFEWFLLTCFYCRWSL